MKKLAALLVALCLLLSGCSSWASGSYSSVVPHIEASNQAEKKTIPVYSYEDLLTALASVVESGEESGIFSMQYGTEETAQTDFEMAVREVQRDNPFAAYGVASIGYVFSETSGRNAVSVRISYQPDRVRTNEIPRVQTLEEVQNTIAQQLDNCGAGVVLYFDTPEQVDYAKFVENYALAHPQTVMEIPVVTVKLYPEEAQQQIVELQFSYKTSSMELRSLQNKVAPVFATALQYVTGNWTEAEKSLRLYNFLMERYEYKIAPSDTPSYSLLLSGVGDCRAFAMVYAAMCQQAGIDCHVITGTRNGKAWAWNGVKLGGTYYYLDLLQCKENGVFALYEQDKMTNYTWDHEAYSFLE